MRIIQKIKKSIKEKGRIGGELVNGGFPRLAKFVAIFAIKIIRMFFYFKSFPNELSGVIRG
jgi:hypothetical protein